MSSTKNLLLAALILAPLAATAEEAKAPTVKFGGTVDAYYLLNLDSPQSDVNPVRAGAPIYDGQPGFNLNYAKLAIDVDADPAGLKLDLAFGPEGAQITNNSVQQAYAFMKFGKATLAFGRFVTPAGFEVFEQKDNWFASKGLIFSWAVPTAHEGVRLSFPVTPELTVTGYIANGNDLFSNDTGGTASPYKTAILSAVYAKDSTTAAFNAFFTKNPDGTVPESDRSGYLLDVVLTQGFGALTANLSGDYGSINGGSWFAIGASGKLSVADDAFRLVGRVEYFDDPDGIRTATAGGVNVMDVTVGANMPVGANSELRAEVRFDKASEKIFKPADPKDTAITFQVSALAWF